MDLPGNGRLSACLVLIWSRIYMALLFYSFSLWKSCIACHCRELDVYNYAYIYFKELEFIPC